MVGGDYVLVAMFLEPCRDHDVLPVVGLRRLLFGVSLERHVPGIQVQGAQELRDRILARSFRPKGLGRFLFRQSPFPLFPLP